MQIDCRGLYRPMAEKTADRIKVGALIKKVGSKTMTEAMNAAGFVYTGFFLLFTKTLRAAE